jgi:hypothetical protein
MQIIVVAVMCHTLGAITLSRSTPYRIPYVAK